MNFIFTHVDTKYGENGSVSVTKSADGAMCSLHTNWLFTSFVWDNKRTKDGHDIVCVHDILNHRRDVKLLFELYTRGLPYDVARLALPIEIASKYDHLVTLGDVNNHGWPYVLADHMDECSSNFKALEAAFEYTTNILDITVINQ